MYTYKEYVKYEDSCSWIWGFLDYLAVSHFYRYQIWKINDTILMSWQSSVCSKKSYEFIEVGDPLLCTQEPIAGYYSQPTEVTSCPHILLLGNPFYYVLFVALWSGLFNLHFLTKILYAFLMPPCLLHVLTILSLIWPP